MCRPSPRTPRHHLAAQFCIGRCLLKQQLTVLGFAAAGETLEAPGRVLMNMYEEMGTQIALQYGGSQALHAPNSNAAKDFLQSVKRFYRNTFTDVEKQHIMDVFLGVYSPLPGRPHIWGHVEGQTCSAAGVSGGGGRGGSNHMIDPWTPCPQTI